MYGNKTAWKIAVVGAVVAVLGILLIFNIGNVGMAVDPALVAVERLQ